MSAIQTKLTPNTCGNGGEMQKYDECNTLYLNVGESLCGSVLSAKVVAVQVFREAELLQARQVSGGQSYLSGETQASERPLQLSTRQRSSSLLSFVDADPQVAVYHISVETYHCQYQVVKRFSEFHSFKEYINCLLRSMQHPSMESIAELFPPKTLFTSLDPEFLEARRLQLQVYLDAVLEIDFCVPAVSRFLEGDKYSQLR